MSMMRKMLDAATTASGIAGKVLGGAFGGSAPSPMPSTSPITFPGKVGGLTSATGPVPPAASLEDSRSQNRARMQSRYGIGMPQG